MCRTHHLLKVLLALFVFLTISWAGEPKAPVVFVWDTGTNPVPSDAFFTIGSDTSIFQRVGASGEQIQAFQISKDRIEPEYLPNDNWGEPAYGYRLALRMENLKFPLGSPVYATVAIRNISTNTLSLVATGAERDFQFVVIDHQKQLVPLTDYGKGLMKRRMNGGSGPFLIPRSQLKYNIQIDRIFDLSKKGEYVIYARRHIYVINEKHPDGAFHSEVVSGNARFQIVDAPKTAGQVNPGHTAATSSPAPAASENSGAPSVVGKSQSADSHPSATAAVPKSTANTSKNILQPTPKAASNQTPAQLAQAETGGGWSKRDWVFSLLVLGVVLGLGWYLFRARSPHPKS